MNKDTIDAIDSALKHTKAIGKINQLKIDDSEAEGKWFWKMAIQVQAGFEHLLEPIKRVSKDIGWLNGEGLWIKTEGRWIWLS